MISLESWSNQHFMLQPGVYSAFVLKDGGTWEQATFEIFTTMPVHGFRVKAAAELGGFATVGVEEATNYDPRNTLVFKDHF